MIFGPVDLKVCIANRSLGFSGAFVPGINLGGRTKMFEVVLQIVMGVEPKIGGCLPPKWMVNIMEKTLLNLDDLGSSHYYFWKHPSI